MTLNRAKEIELIVRSLAKEHGTREPEILAESMGILVDYAEHPNLLGFCGYMMDVPFIGLNSRADDFTARCVCAHEIGHLALEHPSDEVLRIVRAGEMQNMESTYEAEANCFAAALLLRDKETLEMMEQYGDLASVAAALYVCPELVIAKAHILRLKGKEIRIPEMNRMWRR